MAYEGDELPNGSPILSGLKLTGIECVFVSGDGVNVYGHAIAHCIGGSDAYFHVVGDADSPGWKYAVNPGWGLGSRLTGKPRYMDGAGFKRYLSETGKSEWGRVDGKITSAGGATAYLQKRCLSTWFWGAVAHNCVSFVREVIAAGGGSLAGDSNFPWKVAKAAGVPGLPEIPWWAPE